MQKNKPSHLAKFCIRKEKQNLCVIQFEFSQKNMLRFLARMPCLTMFLDMSYTERPMNISTMLDIARPAPRNRSRPIRVTSCAGWY